MCPIKFNPGHYICRQHDRGDCFFIILNGKVRCCRPAVYGDKEYSVDREIEGQEQPMVDLKMFYKFDFFGELALINPSGKRNAHCIAIDEVECMFLHRQHLNQVPQLLEVMGIQSVIERYGDTIVEQENEDFASIDVIDEEANNSFSKLPTNSSSMFANLAAHLIPSKKSSQNLPLLKTANGNTSVSSKASIWKQKLRRVKYKIRKLGHEQLVKMKESLYGRLLTKFHNHPELEDKFDKIMHQVNFIDRKSAFPKLKQNLNGILLKPPASRSFLEVQLIYQMVSELSFWSIMCQMLPSEKKLSSSKHIRLYEMKENSSPYVYRKGDEASCFYIVILGNLSIFSSHNLRGKIMEKEKKSLKPGSCFGLMGVLNANQKLRYGKCPY